MGQGASERDLTMRQIIEYENPDVIESFMGKYDVSHAEAKDIFRELMKFLWLGHVSDVPSVRAIDNPLIIIDEMWHTFILFTKSYGEFCRDYFGQFRHHQPSTASDKTPDFTHDELIEDQRERYGEIIDHLGEHTFEKWFFWFPEVYSVENIRNMRK